MAKLATLGLDTGGPWTAGVPLYGGGLSRPGLLARVAQAPPLLSRETCRRWAFTYGDQIERLYEQVLLDPKLAREIAPGVPLVELEHAVAVEDAITAVDFLERRTKLALTLDPSSRKTVEAWFVRGGA
jgi:glycerol-3-phosphate dehydrogenase